MTSEANTTAGALSGIRVLQVGRTKPTAFCGKLLADLGAEVVTMPSAAADRIRDIGPFHPKDTAREFGGLEWYLDSHKTPIVDALLSVDWTDPSDLLAGFDVLLEDETSASRAWTGTYDGLVRCTITPFGLTGPHAGYVASHLNFFHAGGESALVPIPGVGWPPLQSGSEVASYDVGSHATVAVLAALWGRRATGVGEWIDLSCQEVLISENRTTMIRYFHDGTTYDYNKPGYGDSLYPTADGHVIISFGVPEKALARLAALDEGDVFNDPKFANGGWRMPEVRDVFASELRAWCLARTTARVVELLELAGWPVGAVNSATELLASEQLRIREFFTTAEHPAAGEVRIPGPPIRVSGAEATRTIARLAQPPTGMPTPPLDGIRVLDFTWAAAGPYPTYLLAHLGAEVIKVEHPDRPDSPRRGFQMPPPPRQPGPVWFYGSADESPNFNDLAANKRSLRLDLAHPNAQEVVRRLITHCDLVTSNFRPGVMDKLGIGPDWLLEQNSRLVVAAVSASGSSGPERERPGYANVFAATGGLSAQTGFVDGPPTEGGDSVDFRCGSAVAVGLIAALFERERTGRGQFVDVACQEVVAAYSPDALLRQALSAPLLGRMGNHHQFAAPHNVYRCAGLNRWITIVVEDDDEWFSLCEAIARSDLAKSHATAELRKADEAHIDAVINEWTTRQDVFEATKILQRAGVRAAPCLSNRDLAVSDHLAARGMFVDVKHPVMGLQRVVRPPWLMANAPRVLHQPGPLLGEANDYVLDEILQVTGITRDTLAEAMT